MKAMNVHKIVHFQLFLYLFQAFFTHSQHSITNVTRNHFDELITKLIILMKFDLMHEERYFHMNCRRAFISEFHRRWLGHNNGLIFTQSLMCLQHKQKISLSLQFVHKFFLLFALEAVPELKLLSDLPFFQSLHSTTLEATTLLPLGSRHKLHVQVQLHYQFSIRKQVRK